MPTPEMIAELSRVRTIDLTTIGRRSGTLSRVEIWWFYVAERFIITGTPGKRDWFANILANPAIVVHTPVGDFPGQADVITDPGLRRQVFTDGETSWYKSQTELESLVATAPMIEVRLH